MSLLMDTLVQVIVNKVIWDIDSELLLAFALSFVSCRRVI